MSDSAPDNLEAAIAWIRAQAPLLYFGRASIEILAHNGKITRIITSVEVSTAAGSRTINAEKPMAQANSTEIRQWLDQHIEGIQWQGDQGEGKCPLHEDSRASFWSTPRKQSGSVTRDAVTDIYSNQRRLPAW